MESFHNLFQVVDHCGGNFGVHPSLITYNLAEKGITTPSNTEKTNAEEESREAYLAISFLSGLNREKYQELLDNLSNSFLSGRDEYPKTVVDDYNLVVNWKGRKNTPRLKLNNGVNFNTLGDEMYDDKTANVNDGTI